jgi:hypothetical protein
MEAVYILVPVVIAAAILLRLAAGGMDRERVKRYTESQGGTVLGSSWAPFGPGWFGEKSDRIYRVLYRDQAGNTHEAHCKTSLLTGVYFTEDRIVEQANRAGGEDESLEAENRRLREELERLKRRGPDGTA